MELPWRRLGSRDVEKGGRGPSTARLRWILGSAGPWQRQRQQRGWKQAPCCLGDISGQGLCEHETLTQEGPALSRAGGRGRAPSFLEYPSKKTPPSTLMEASRGHSGQTCEWAEILPRKSLREHASSTLSHLLTGCPHYRLRHSKPQILDNTMVSFNPLNPAPRTQRKTPSNSS